MKVCLEKSDDIQLHIPSCDFSSQHVYRRIYGLLDEVSHAPLAITTFIVDAEMYSPDSGP